jgi:ABC-type amino acid transport substrate-binding protein
VDPQVASSLLAYMALHVVGTFGLAFVVLPLMLRRMVAMRYREILAELRPALTLALVTTLSAAALPQIQKVAERLARARGIEGEEADDVIRATLSISYVLCQLGNYFIALFVIYLGYHHRVALSLADVLLLPPMTLLAGIGSPSASVDAVSFLAQWLHLPSDAADLYVETMTVTRYGQVALSVMGFAFVTLIVPIVYFRRGRYDLRTIATGAGAGLLLFGGVVLAGRALGPVLFPHPSDAAVMARGLDAAAVAGVDVEILRARPDPLVPVQGAGTFEGIRARGRIRIGYGVDIVPFSYFNAAGELVGFDVAAAYRLARDLHVAIEFVPVDWMTLEADLNAGLYDLVMAGAYATPDRIRALDLSRFYLTSPVALIVRADQAGAYRDYDGIVARPGLRVAVFRDPVLEPLAKSLFPDASVVELDSYDELPQDPSIDAAIWTQEQAASWAGARTGYTAIVPVDIGTPLPFSYLLPDGSSDLTRYVDLWLDLEEARGTRARELDYWIHGKPRPDDAHRWSILDALLIPWATDQGWMAPKAERP